MRDKKSHPSRMRGLKSDYPLDVHGYINSRIPRGCVD